MTEENDFETDRSLLLTSDQETCLEISPGLMGLNLNIMQALDMDIIQDVKLNFSNLLKKEHDIVQNVQENIIALLKMKIPRERREGRIALEGILKTCPNNLNALADLEYVYRELNRRSDADQCKSTIDRIMRSKKKDDMQCKQTCLLEQGYAILIGRTLFDKSTVEQRITDLTKILNTEQERSEGIRKQCLERGIHHQIQVLRNYQNANEEDARDGHIVRKASSLQKFEMAEKMFSTPFPHIVWTFYHAKALNQYYDTLEVMSRYKQDMKKEMALVTVESVEKFWTITQYSTEQDMNVVRARSFAYIGHILMKRENLVKSEERAFIKDDTFQSLLTDPLTAFHIASKIQPNDITVLNRYGRSLWNKSNATQDSKEKLKHLKSADRVLTDSITNGNNSNWFAHSTRMIVRLFISDIENRRSDNHIALNYLNLAIEDGIECFKSRGTRRDMGILAEALQKLAKFPNVRKYGREYVRNLDHLYQALDYLFFASHLGSPLDFHWPSRIASCLFDLGEIENAIEWQRKAWFLSSPKSTMSFYLLCLFMITLFEDKSKMQTPVDQFLREFLYTLVYAKSKYKNMNRKIKNQNEIEEEFTSNMKGLFTNKREGLLKLLRAIIIENTITLRESEMTILIDCLDIWTKMWPKDNVAEFEHLQTKLIEVTPAKEIEYLLSDVFSRTSSLRPLAKNLKPCSEDFTYDFFVSHSHKDQDWVVNILLRHLESKFDDKELTFKGCIADRDFVPGMSVFDNIIAAIKGSHKVILILTQHFITSNWCQYEADHAIIKSLEFESEETQQEKFKRTPNVSDSVEDRSDTQNRTNSAPEEEENNKKPENKESTRRIRNRDCVIPIVLEDCKIPDKIKHLNYIDMTDKNDFIEQMMRLKKALLPVEI